MIKGKCHLWAAAFLMFFGSYTISEAAYFSISGTSNIYSSYTETLTLKGPCNWAADKGTWNTVIVADRGETNGDPVILHYCYAVIANSSIADTEHTAIGGVGGALLTGGCNPRPVYNNPRPVTLILDPGAAEEKTVISYDPVEVGGNAKFSLTDQCGRFQAYVGGTIEFNGGVFAVVGGTTFPELNTNISISLTLDISISSGRCCPD